MLFWLVRTHFPARPLFCLFANKKQNCYRSDIRRSARNLRFVHSCFAADFAARTAGIAAERDSRAADTADSFAGVDRKAAADSREHSSAAGTVRNFAADTEADRQVAPDSRAADNTVRRSLVPDSRTRREFLQCLGRQNSRCLQSRRPFWIFSSF